MKINPMINASAKFLNFNGVTGKKEIDWYHGSGIDTVSTTVHFYPFKDEFISKEEQERKTKEISDKTKEANLMAIQKTNVKFENPLPFTKEEFEYALQCPNSSNASKEALNFIASDDYCATVMKHTGFGFTQ